MAAGMMPGLIKASESPSLDAGSGVVMLAHDTRPSAEELIKAAGSGVKALGGLPIVCGLLTTPQLHWMVRPSGSSQSHNGFWTNVVSMESLHRWVNDSLKTLMQEPSCGPLGFAQCQVVHILLH